MRKPPRPGWSTLTFVCVLSTALLAQSSTPSFEVASVKRNTSGEGFVNFGTRGDRFTATNAPLWDIVRIAFAMQPFQIIGAPEWLRSERYDVAAKAERTPSRDQLAAMLRGLLADRFKLKTHTESRELPIYELLLARADGRAGPRLRRSETDCSPEALDRRDGGRGMRPSGSTGLRPGERPECGMMAGPGRFTAGGATMAQLSTMIANNAGRTVVDKTGLSGYYAFDLEFTPDRLSGPPPPGAPRMPAIDPNGPSLFTALQEQLGLKLESRRGPVEVLVIDSVDRPTLD